MRAVTLVRVAIAYRFSSGTGTDVDGWLFGRHL
jgi:hypothetical protein